MIRFLQTYHEESLPKEVVTDDFGGSDEDNGQFASFGMDIKESCPSVEAA